MKSLTINSKILSVEIINKSSEFKNVILFGSNINLNEEMKDLEVDIKIAESSHLFVLRDLLSKYYKIKTVLISRNLFESTNFDKKIICIAKESFGATNQKGFYLKDVLDEGEDYLLFKFNILLDNQTHFEINVEPFGNYMFSFEISKTIDLYKILKNKLNIYPFIKALKHSFIKK
jgi:hypothetical protein